MTHEDALNRLLSEQCCGQGGEWSEYEFDLCCTTMIIEARCVASPPEWKGEDDPPEEWRNAFKYEIKGIRTK